MGDSNHTTATILVNPSARRVQKHFDADGALRFLQNRGIDARLEQPGSVAAFTWAACESADRGDNLLFVSGGDGTIRIAAGAIAGSETALAALPGGTANVWAREAGLPLGFRTAMEAHLDGQTVPVDLGRANDEPFLLMAGAGWDASIASRVDMKLKRRIGPGAYVLRGAADIPRLRTVPVRWRTPDGEYEMDAGIILVSNVRQYGGVVSFTPDALVDDGLLDLYIAGPHNVRHGLIMAGRFAVGLLNEDPDLVRARIPEIDIETPGLPYQLDGDVLGETPLSIRVEHKALNVSLPAGDLPPVFTAANAEPATP